MDRKWVVLSNTSLATVMSNLDFTIVIIALPTIARQLPQTSTFTLLWIVLGYQLVLSSVLVNFGRLADIFGRVRLYILGFAVFTVGSALSSLSQTGDQLMVFRIVQAVGAAFIVSNTSAIITDAFTPEERGRALGINQIVSVSGNLSGLVLGGFLTSTLGWQSIFWVNIPIGVVATLWAHYKLRGLTTDRGSHEGIDLYGNVTLVAGIFLLLATVSMYTFGLIDAVTAVVMGAAGAALMPVFVRIERRAANPMLDLDLFRIRAFIAGNTAVFINGLARGTTSLILAFYLQGPTMRLTPAIAGLFLLPFSLAAASFGLAGGSFADKYGARRVSTLALLVSILGFVFMSQIGPVISFPDLAFRVILVGGGTGAFLISNISSVLSSVPASRRGVASGTYNMLQNLGQTFSTAISFFAMTTTMPVSYVRDIFSGISIPNEAQLGANLIIAMHTIYLLAIALLLLNIIPSVLRGRTGEQPRAGPAGP